MPFLIFLFIHIGSKLSKASVETRDLCTNLSQKIFFVLLVPILIIACIQSVFPPEEKNDSSLSYIDALKNILSTLPSDKKGLKLTEESNAIHLGKRDIKSTVAAPFKAYKGESFIISVLFFDSFLHQYL